MDSCKWAALLTLFSDEMKQMFDPCIDRVVELIQGQIQQVERTKNRVKVCSRTSAIIYLQAHIVVPRTFFWLEDSASLHISKRNSKSR